MRAYVESLPHTYLLTLHLSEMGSCSLAAALRRALRSTRRSVWIDCRHVPGLSADVLRRLRRCASQLWRHGGYLMLCHLPDATRADLVTDASQPLAASLLDAAQYGLAWPTSHS